MSDDLNTFDGWLKYQAVDLAALTPDELKQWRIYFDETQKNQDPKVGLLKLKARPGEKLYAVAVRDGDNLWLVLWIRRNRTGEFFVMVPRSKEGWDPHTSYHRDGTFHSKSFNRKHVVAEGIADGAEYASARLVSRHGGAHQPDWGIAVRLPMGSTGRCVHSESAPGLARNDAAFARRAPLDREYARIANRD
jgi:hypothetical protein